MIEKRYVYFRTVFLYFVKAIGTLSLMYRMYVKNSKNQGSIKYRYKKNHRRCILDIELYKNFGL